MPQYRRAIAPGGTFFFTVVLHDRQSDVLTTHAAALKAAFAKVKQQRPFLIDAIVVLPDHLHCLWTLPPDDADFSTRWRLIKTAFARSLPFDETPSPHRQRRGERTVWQRRFWEHLIRDEDDFARHADYIHYNPVKHGLVLHPGDWPHSSFQRFVERGVYPKDWAAPMSVQSLVFE